MRELSDYSGEFIPDIKYEDMSRETLAKLLHDFTGLYVMLDGFWHTLIIEKLDEETACDCGTTVYEKIAPHMMPRIKKTLKIEENNVIALLKVLQFDPAVPPGLVDFVVDIKSPNHAIQTVTKCRALEFMEREGKGREAIVCPKLELGALTAYAKAMNPAMEVNLLKVPPRKNKDESPCQWEFIIRE